MPAPPSIIDHIGLFCPADLVDEEAKFLSAALGPLGIKEQFRIMPEVVALGDTPQNAFLWISGLRKDVGRVKDPVTPTHLALKAKGRIEWLCWMSSLADSP